MNTRTNVPKYTLGNARWLVAAAVLLSLFLVSQATIKPALAYSCGNPSSGHCYATTDDANFIMIGAKTNIYVAPLSCGFCGSNGIINEMWYGDPYGENWVETGYWSQTDGSIGQTQRYFCADRRPIDCRHASTSMILLMLPAMCIIQHPSKSFMMPITVFLLMLALILPQAIGTAPPRQTIQCQMAQSRWVKNSVASVVLRRLMHDFPIDIGLIQTGIGTSLMATTGSAMPPVRHILVTYLVIPAKIFIHIAAESF